MPLLLRPYPLEFNGSRVFFQQIVKNVKQNGTAIKIRK